LIDYLALSDRPPETLAERIAVTPLGIEAPGDAVAATPAQATPAPGAPAPAPNANPMPVLTRADIKDWKPQPVWKHIFRRRTLIYTALWATIGIGLLVALFVRPEIELTVAPVRNPTFVTLSDGTIRNAYDIRLRNKHGEPRLFHVWLPADSPLQMDVEGEDDSSVIVPATSTERIRVYVDARPEIPEASADRTEIRFWVADLVSQERAHKDTLFFGKESFDVRSHDGP
jgi:polyferredoxin